MFNMKQVGKKIVSLRKSRNMTQTELADKMDVSFQAVSNWERGNSMPDISKLPQLAALFDCTRSWRPRFPYCGRIRWSSWQTACC